MVDAVFCRAKLGRRQKDGGKFSSGGSITRGMKFDEEIIALNIGRQKRSAYICGGWGIG